VHAFEHWGGIPGLTVPDNTKTGVIKAHRYDPDLNPTYYNFALHCGFGIVPARPYKPRDKAKVENAVQVAQRWIVAALRHHKFFSLEELNGAIRELLDNERANFAGRWYTLTDATFEPRPVQSPLPLLVGTAGSRMLRTVAKYANAWNTWGNPSTVAAVTERFTSACEAEGRDPASILRSAQALVYVTDTDAQRDELLAKVRADRAIVGSTAEIVDVIGQYAEAGLDEFALPDFNLGATPAQRRERIERFHEEVVSKLSTAN
jgi:alkanesulfonate monooxygenase SsuD/methylene tetrahydromethanopterin reductase-like flavin-dependent oxidoreductase (luciferase family)